MKTVYSTGPGFYAADTTEGDPTVPPNVLRVYCVRMESYDLDCKTDLSLSFHLIFAKAEEDKRIAKSLLSLRDAINANETILKRLLE